MACRWEGDLEVIGILMHIEKDSPHISLVLTHTLDILGSEQPVMDLLAVLLGRDMPDVDGLLIVINVHLHITWHVHFVRF